MNSAFSSKGMIVIFLASSCSYNGGNNEPENYGIANVLPTFFLTGT